MTHKELSEYTHEDLTNYTHLQLSLPLEPLITFRKQADINRILYLLGRMQSVGYDGLLDSEKAEWSRSLRGAYNASDLNRVGGYVQYIVNWLKYYAYLITVDAKTDWQREDFATPSTMSTYLGNLHALVNGYCATPGAGALPEDMEALTFEEANAIERLLEELIYAITGMESNYRYAGDLISGEGYFC